MQIKPPILAIFIVGIVFVLGVLCGFWISHELTIDGCLDGGGRWDKSAGICEH
jgi:hypothetical protein